MPEPLRRGSLHTEQPRILCLIDGDSEKARYSFSLAAEDGSGEAAYNLAHFDELSCKW